KEVVLHAMEEAMQRAAKAHYGSENDIHVEIDAKTGETHVSRYLNVVELVDNDKTEISLEDARARNPAAQVGDIIAETLPPLDFNRVNAQNAKANTRNTRTASAKSSMVSSSAPNSARWWWIFPAPKAWSAATR